VSFRLPETSSANIQLSFLLGPITLIKLSNDQQTIAYANPYGEVALHSLKSMISKSNCVKLPNSGVCTSLFWHYTDKELYCGDTTGNVSVINLAFFIGRNLLNVSLHPILLLDSPIIQIDGFNEFLLVSSQTKTILCNNEREEFKQIGNRPREGNFGACFCIDFERLKQQEANVTTIDEYDEIMLQNVTIYCSRPGMRLWEVDLNGNVKRTHQFKNANFKSQQLQLLNASADSSPSLIDKTNQFQLIHAINSLFVFTWNACGFYVIDPRSSKVLFWSSEFNETIIAYAKVIGSSIYLYLKDGRLLELKLFKLQHYALQLCQSEAYIEAGDLIKNHLDYFLHLLRVNHDIPEADQYRAFLKIRDYLIANEYNDLLNKVMPVFDELAAKKHVQHVVILSKSLFSKPKPLEVEKAKEVVQQVPEEEENDSLQVARAVKQLYITHQASLNSNLGFRDRIAKIFDQFKNSTIIRILVELEKLFVENGDYQQLDAKRTVCKMFLDYLQPEIIFEIDDDSTLNYIADALVQVQHAEGSVSCCQRCEFPLNCGSGSSGYEEIGNILQQFYWSRKEYEKCYELCRSLPFLLKITGKFITDERNWDRMIPYAINLGDLEILHKSLELFNDISLFQQLLDDYCMACEGKFKCLKCDEINDVSEVHKILTWDCLFQAIEFYLCGHELLELLKQYSPNIPSGAISRQFYLKLLIHASD